MNCLYVTRTLYLHLEIDLIQHLVHRDGVKQIQIQI